MKTLKQQIESGTVVPINSGLIYSESMELFYTVTRNGHYRRAKAQKELRRAHPVPSQVARPQADVSHAILGPAAHNTPFGKRAVTRDFLAYARKMGVI